MIYYWNLNSPPEGREGALKIIDELRPDMIWYSHWVVGFPMVPDVESAYKIAKRCGLPDERARKFQEWVRRESYTLRDLREQVKEVEGRGIIYCPSLLGYSNFRVDFNFDPLTFECLSEEEVKSMLLNFGKWGIINPETGKPYTLEETQSYLKGIAASLGLNFSNLGVFDTSSEKLIEYQVRRAVALKRAGVRAVWFDLFFQLPLRVSRLLNLSLSHPMVKDLYEGVKEIVERARGEGLMVGTWVTALQFPYEPPKLDFLTESPSSREVLNVKVDYGRWDEIAKLIKEKEPDSLLIIILDFGERDNLPLAIFSQRLSPDQQRKFLVELRNLADYLRKRYGLNVAVAYPVHGPGIGAGAERLAWGKYRIYDAKAPEFDTYEVIREFLSEP